VPPPLVGNFNGSMGLVLPNLVWLSHDDDRAGKSEVFREKFLGFGTKRHRITTQ